MRFGRDTRRLVHLADMLFRSGGKERLMAFLEGYFDESGTHGSASSHVVVERIDRGRAGLEDVLTRLE